MHALICARVDYGNVVYISLSSTNASKLQSVLNAAARLIGGIPKFSHISTFIRNSLHWLPIRQRIQFKICSLVRSCLTDSAPQYLNVLKAYCIPVSSIPSCSTHRSSARGHLVVTRTWTYYMTQSRSFAIVGPSNWTKLTLSLRDLFPISSAPFHKHLKPLYLSVKTLIWVGSASDLSGAI